MSVKQIVCLSMVFMFGCSASQASEGKGAQAPLHADAAGSAASAATQCLEDANAGHEVPPNAPGRVQLSQILVRHADLKEPQGATRNREQACMRALEALAALKQSGDWERVAHDFNDAQSADLGWVKREELRPAFAAAAFELSVEQLSYVVETDRGFHIILRRQ